MGWAFRRPNFYPWLCRNRFGRAQLAHKSCAEKLCDGPGRRGCRGVSIRAGTGVASERRIRSGTEPPHDDAGRDPLKIALFPSSASGFIAAVIKIFLLTIDTQLDIEVLSP